MAEFHPCGDFRRKPLRRLTARCILAHDHVGPHWGPTMVDGYETENYHEWPKESHEDRPG